MPLNATPTLYGIPNCGSVKKARAWLEARGVVYRFVDFKKTPPPTPNSRIGRQNAGGRCC
ncbi:hypothetical protein CGLAMM_00735 [Acetobacteraceae bacterium EV16G]